MITTMPLKEAQAPYIQPDSIPGKMLQGLSYELINKPTIVFELITGNTIKTPLMTMQEASDLLSGNFNYTELDKIVETNCGHKGDTSGYVTPEYIEGEQEKATTIENFIAIPELFFGAFRAVSVKYRYVNKEHIRQFSLRV